MIKKGVFEDDLVQGMQTELRKQASEGIPSLVKAGECLHAALEILEEAGFQSSANRVFAVLEKIAAGTKNIQRMPSKQHLLDAGLTEEDLRNFGAGQHHAKVKMNSALRRMGLNDDEIKGFIGPHNFLTPQDIASYVRLLDMIKNPTKEPANNTIEMKSLVAPEQDGDGDELTFKSLASKPHHPRRPDTINDRHTKGLTSEKEVKNYERYGWPFNLADDGAADDISYAIDALNADFDENFAEALGVTSPDELSIDDIMSVEDELDSDINQKLSDEDWETWKTMRPKNDLWDEPVPEDRPTVRDIPIAVPSGEFDIVDDLPLVRTIKVKDADKLGDRDITEADDMLDVSDPESMEDFEDEASSLK